MVADQVADATIKRFMQEHPLPPARAEMPPALKLWGSIAAAVLTLVVTTGVLWMAATLNALQITVARMDERQQRDTTGTEIQALKERDLRHDERLSKLEQRKGEQ